MSLDGSLKGKSTLERHRNVLRRAERIVLLEDNEKWTENGSVFGLVKVAHRKMAAGKKPAKAEAAADGTATTAPAAGSAAAPAGKAAAPAAKGAKK